MAAKKKASAKKKTTTKPAPKKKTVAAAKKVAKAAAPAKKKASSKKPAATKKVEAKKVEAKKVEPKKVEPKKVEPKKVEPKKVEAKKVETKKAETKKMSPLRGTSVDDWAKKLTGWQSDALKLVRALVLRHAPAATLAMKWGQPVWEQNGPFAYARPSAEHLTFGFWRGADLEDPNSVLEGDGDRMRHVKITSIEDVSRLPLEEFIREAIDLNEQKGDPTKREASGKPANP